MNGTKKPKRKTPWSALIRVDANAHIGSGHLIRCLSLAQALKSKGHPVAFAVATPAAALRRSINSGGFKVIAFARPACARQDAEQTAVVAARLNARWIIADGYGFNYDFQRVIKAHGLKLFTIDDHRHFSRYAADIILDQNLSVGARRYRKACGASARLLTGSRYVLLRPQFSRYRTWRRAIKKKARTVLVTLGGGDAGNVTLKVIRALDRIKGYPIRVLAIAGSSNPHYAVLRKFCRKKGSWLRLIRSVDNMAALMAKSDFAITGSGSTCWESLYMQLPSAMITLADNQRPIAGVLAGKKLAWSAGWYKSVRSLTLSNKIKVWLNDVLSQKKIALTGRRVIDGQGAGRAALAMERIGG